MSRLALVSLAAAATATLSGCRDGGTAPLPGDLAPVVQGVLEGVAGEPLPDSVRVRVIDMDGDAIAGAAVTFQTDDGTVSPTTTRSDGEGVARVLWTLGTRAGVPQTLRATSGPESIEMEAVASPGPPAELVAIEGDGQAGFAAEPLAQPIAVRIADRYGNATPGRTVEWEASPGAGTIDPSDSPSDEEGRIEARWTLGESTGEVSAAVRSDGVPELGLSATALRNARIRGSVSEFGGYLAPGRVAVGNLNARGPTPAGPSTPMAPQDAGSVPDELLIMMEPSGGPAGVPGARGSLALRAPAAVVREMGDLLAASARTLPAADAFEVLEVAPTLGTIRVRVRPGLDPDAVAALLRTDGSVRAVTRNEYLETIHPVPPPPGSTTSPAEGFGLPQSVRTPRGSAPARTASGSFGAGYAPSADPDWRRQSWHYEQILAYDAWKLTRGRAEIVVAVVDDGIRTDHPDIAPRLLPGYSFVDSTPLPLCGGGTVPADGHGEGPGPDARIPRAYAWSTTNQCVTGERATGGHGLHVAGTIAAEVDNAYLGSGVAPGVRILPVRVMDGRGMGTTFDIAQGILYAAGIPVTVGGGGTIQAAVPARIINLSLGGYSASPVRAAAVEAAHAMGAVIVASAGNDGVGQLSFPARYPQVIGVGAVDAYTRRAGYSNHGPDLDIAAPGGALYLGNPLMGVCSTVWNFEQAVPGYECWQGTSMAAPHVSAVAALVWSMQPGLDNEGVRNVLRETAWQPLPGSTDYGSGIVQALPAVSGSVVLPGRRFAFLYDARGERVDEADLDEDGSFEFARLPDGPHFVYAGRDELDDGITGLPPRLWGAFTGPPSDEPGPTGSPLAVGIDGHGIYEANPNAGWPLESGTNTSPDDADLLPLGGYLTGLIEAPLEAKYYRVPVPEAGPHTFQTRGALGACGFPIGADTRIDLLDAQGGVIAGNDDLDAAAENFCSYLDVFLEAGDYLVRVSGSGSATGYFQIAARRQGD